MFGTGSRIIQKLKYVSILASIESVGTYGHLYIEQCIISLDPGHGFALGPTPCMILVRVPI